MAFFDKAWYVNGGDGSTTGYYAVPVWPGTSHSVAAGTWTRQLTTSALNAERCFVAIAGGTTSASAEPTWITTRGGKTTDGSVIWQECTGMPGPNGDLTNSTIRANSTGYTLGTLIYDATSGSLQILSTASGNTASSAPSFSATAGVTTNDASNVWTSLGPVSNYTTPFKYPHARGVAAFTSTWGQAGNQFAVASTHTESQAATMNWNTPGNSASPCQVLCISNTTTLAAPTLASGAIVRTTGANFLNAGASGSAYYNGIIFDAGNGSSGQVQLVYGGTANSNSISTFEQCTFTLASNTNAGSTIQPFASEGLIDCNIDIGCNWLFGNAGQSIQLSSGAATIRGGTVAASGVVPNVLFTGESGGQNATIDLLVRDLDLSVITGTLIGLSTVYVGGIELEYCKLASGVTLVSGSAAFAYGSYARVHNCDSAATNYRYYFQNYQATVQQETTIVRTGTLATNGTTPMSWNITTSANNKFLQPFFSDEITQWCDLNSGSHTATFYLTSNTALSNNQIWVDLEFMGDSGSPQGTVVSSRMAILGTPTALTTDSSTWGGSTTFKYSIALPFTPRLVGPIKAKVYCGIASATVYFDPYIYIT